MGSLVWLDPPSEPTSYTLPPEDSESSSFQRVWSDLGAVLIGRGLAERALHLTRAIALSPGRRPWTCPGGSSCFACEALEFYMEVGNHNDAVRSANRLCYPHDYFTCQDSSAQRGEIRQISRFIVDNPGLPTTRCS